MLMKIGNMFLHDVSMFEKLWEEVGRETGTQWKVEAVLVGLEHWGLDRDDFEWMGEDRRGLNFSCTRIS